MLRNFIKTNSIMSSPLKSVSTLLLNKGKLSPLAPRLLTPIKNHNSTRASFQFSNQESKANYLKTCTEQHKTTTSNVQIRITEPSSDCDEETFMINSPNKTDLMQHGFSKYYLLYTIGRGSFGTVIKGKYKGTYILGELVAVKIIKLEKSSECNINEFNAQHLLHENIIRIVDIIKNKNEEFGLIFMEYYKNSRNLQNVIDDLNFNLDTRLAINFSKDIVKGIKYCHENGILHLDIKPKNILLCNNLCKICDFGNSVKETEAVPIFNYKGTVAYTAPEILRGQKPTTKSDIFSLGILFWQIITRKVPYEYLNKEVVIYKVVKFNLRPDLYLIENVKDFSKLCKICWEELPDYRPEASDVYKILNTF